jgi:hypothetical protein
MSISLGTQVIAANTPTSFEAPSDGVKAILIGNESGLTVTITMESGGVQKTLYPSTVDWFDVRRGFTGNIRITPTVILNNVATFPASSLIFDAIGLNDPEDSSQYPVTLNRSMTVGGMVSTVGGTSSAIANDNNAAGTSIIEATVTADGASAVSLTNDAVFVLGDATHKGSLTVAGPVTLNAAGVGLTVASGDIDAGASIALTVNNRFLKGKDQAGTIYHIAGYDSAVAKQLDIGDATAGILANIVSNTKVNGTLEATGVLTADSTSTLTGVVTAAAANILGAAGNLQHILGQLTVDQTALITGILTLGNTLQFLQGTLTRIDHQSYTPADNATHTYNHSLGAVPDIVLAQVHGNITGTTQSVTNFTSTTFDMTASAGGHATDILLIKF